MIRPLTHRAVGLAASSPLGPGQQAGEHVVEIIEVIAAAVAQLTVLGVTRAWTVAGSLRTIPPSSSSPQLGSPATGTSITARVLQLPDGRLLPIGDRLLTGSELRLAAKLMSDRALCDGSALRYRPCRRGRCAWRARLALRSIAEAGGGDAL